MPRGGITLRKAAIGLALLGAVALPLPLLYPALVVPLSPFQQAEVSLALIGLALLASLNPSLRPLIMFLSGYASLRYFYWRVSSTLNLERLPDATASLLLLGAEAYGLVILLLGYFQTVEVHPREPAPLGTPRRVDVFVPTYNEPLEVLRRTVIGALAIDYPGKKVYVLDDGRRMEVADMAARLGCGYLTRSDNRHAKAGNLNAALEVTDGELIAIFDADHVPVSGFLKKVVGFFEDETVAFVQTAQHFFNPDPYERNLKLTGRIASEQSFFYHVIQPGNDFWNSAFFCGSSAVLRRSAILAIGGFKTETVTEDAHTALELHSKGFSSVYLPLPLAAGLATETFAAHVQQRIRWARGMAQILRRDCPLLKRGLTPSQRLNYSNAMLHFFFGFPRLILILSPLSYLLLGIHPVQADAWALLAYIFPHIGLSTLANSLLSDRFRHSFWPGVYEVSIAPFTAGVTLLALINPRLGRFNVTDKGTSLAEARWDFSNAWATIVLLGLTIGALGIAFPIRLSLFARGITDTSELNATLINSVWALANIWTLIAAACVALEQPQQREAPRVKRSFPCRLRSGGVSLRGYTVDMSEMGVRVALEGAGDVPESCEVVVTSDFGLTVALAAQRCWCEWGKDGPEVGLRFVNVDEAAHRTLVTMIFSGDRSWVDEQHPRDDPFRSFLYLLSTLWRLGEPRRARSRRALRVRGSWSCTLLGVEGACYVASVEGAEVEFARPIDVPDGNVSLSFGDFTLSARIVARRGGRRLGLAFDWPDPASRDAFFRGLLAGRERA